MKVQWKTKTANRKILNPNPKKIIIVFSKTNIFYIISKLLLSYIKVTYK